MEIVAFVVLAITTFAGIVVAVLPSSQGRRVKVLLIWLGVPFAVFFGDEIVGQAYLKVRCGLEGGHETPGVVITDGYFDANETRGCSIYCLEALGERGFQYFEAETGGGYDAFHVREKGVYRFRVIDKNQGDCAQGRAIPREPEFVNKDQCVAATKLEQIEARFEKSMIQSTEAGAGIFKAQKVDSYVKDRNSGQLVASATSFRYWGGWVRNNAFGHNSASVCPTWGESHGAVERVLVPAAR